jgi:hypothetical protein
MPEALGRVGCRLIIFSKLSAFITIGALRLLKRDSLNRIGRDSEISNEATNRIAESLLHAAIGPNHNRH